MNSTEIAWRRFLKSEVEAETVPAKDVSLEGKLDTISAQLNRIAVDSERVASTVPELLGDKGVEEALGNEEVPELSTLEGAEAGAPAAEVPEEGAGADAEVADGEIADGEAVDDESDPEGIFTEGEDEDGEIAEEESDADVAEAVDASTDAVQAQGDPTTPVEGAAVAEGDVDEVAGADEEQIPELEDDDADGDILDDEDEDAESDDEEDEEYEEDEYLDVPEEGDGTDDDSDGEESDDESEDEADEDEESDEAEKLIAEAKKAMKKSAYLRMIAKAEEEKCPCECEDEKDTEKIEESEGAATAGSAGMTNGKYGGTDEDTEHIQACAKSVRLFKYGVGPEQTRADGKRGHTGEGQRKEGSQRDRGHYTDRQYAYEAKQKRDKRKAEGAKGNKVDRPKTRSKPGLTASGTTRVKPGKEYGKGRGSKTSEAAETIRAHGKKGRTSKAMMSANIPTKHIATMRDVVGHRQRPVAKAIANSDLERPVFGAEPMRKSAPQMGYGVDPKDVTAADWENYNRIKARRGF